MSEMLINNRYRIVDKIAVGEIYRAMDVTSAYEVVIKVMHPAPRTDPSVVERFYRDAALLLQLRAPHTVRTYDVGEAPDGALYIVTELMRCESLSRRLKRGPLPWRNALAIARGVCSSLAEAHAVGIVHGELSPANINLEPRSEFDFVKLSDLGVSKLRAPSRSNGTRKYMSPEQLAGSTCDVRGDIYTLAVVVFEMIAGRRPFNDSNLASRTAQSAPLLSSFVPVPARLDSLLARCLARRPSHRPSNIIEVIHEIDALLADALGTPRPVAVSEQIEEARTEWPEQSVLDARSSASVIGMANVRAPHVPAPMAPSKLFRIGLHDQGPAEPATYPQWWQSLPSPAQVPSSSALPSNVVDGAGEHGELARRGMWALFVVLAIVLAIGLGVALL